MKLGLPYVAAEWPFGLRCSSCDHLFREGERYAVMPYAFAGDGYLLTTAACVTCQLDSQWEPQGHDA